MLSLPPESPLNEKLLDHGRKKHSARMVYRRKVVLLPLPFKLFKAPLGRPGPLHRLIHSMELQRRGASLTFIKPIGNAVEDDAALATAGDPHEALGPLDVSDVVDVVPVDDGEGAAAAARDPLGELKAVSLLRGVNL